MFLEEALLLAYAVIACKVMTSLSATEPGQNETSRSTLTSMKPLYLKLSSTIVKRSTHQVLAGEQDYPASTQQGDSASTQQDDPASTQQDDPASTQQDDPVSTQQDDPAGTQQDDPASTQVPGNSADGQSRLLAVGQQGLAMTNASVEESHENQNSGHSKSSHTPEIYSPNDSVASTDMYNRSEVNDEARPCFNLSNCLQTASINIYSMTVASPEHNYSSINNWGNETNANKDVNPETTVSIRASALFTASSRSFMQTTDSGSWRASAGTTEKPPDRTAATSQAESGGFDDVILEFGGQMFAVCELDMLCRDRCLQGTHDTSVDTAPTSPNVLRPNTMRNNFQDTTYTYHESASGGSFQETNTERHRRLAGTDAYSRQSGKLQTFLDEYRNPRQSDDGISQPGVKGDLDNSDEAPKRCSDFRNETCFCDVVCLLYGDCCPDVFTSCFHLNTSQDILTFISDVWKHHVGSSPADYPLGMPQSAVDFVVRFASCQKVNPTTGMLLLGKCPEDTRDKSVKRSCEDSSELQLPPVTGNFQQGEVAYRNIFCSRCHGVQDTDVQVWTRQYVCERNVIDQSNKSLTISDLRGLVMAGVCNTSFVPPMDTCQPRQCQTYSRLTDQQKAAIKANVQEGICSEADAMLCQSYYYPTSGFANAHCRTCLDSKQRRRRESLSQPMCDVNLYKYRQQAKQQKPTLISGGILLILDVTGSFSNGAGRSRSTNICQQDEVFDPMLLACRPLSCPVGFRPYAGKCMKVPGQYFREAASQIFPGGWNQLVLTIYPHNASSLPCEISTAVVAYNFSFRELNMNAIHSLDLRAENALSYFSSPECERIIKDKDRVGEMMAHILTSAFFGLPESLDQIPELMIELDNFGFFNHTYQIEISNINSSTAASYRCSGNNSIQQVLDFSVVDNNGTIFVLVNISRQIYYPLGNIGFQVTLYHGSDKSSNWVLNRSVSVCDTWLYLRDNCSVVTYKLNDTRQNGSRLMVLSSGLYYEDGDFQISGDDVLVCTNFSFQYELVTAAIHQSLVYLILTWSLTIISVASLLLMLTLYCLFPQLRTLPGKMTASLAATMMLTFVSNLFTTMQLHHDYICPIAAALSHVISLAHFGWMSAIAVNMALTFGPLNKKLARTASDKALFLRYNLVVWGSSIVVVMTAVTLDLTHPEPNTSEIAIDNYPRYGHPYCTWFSGPTWTKLAFVMVPYLITFVINLVGFLLTLIYIQRTSRCIQKLGKKSSDKSRCMIYLKLSSAMGFSWAVSALSSIYPNIVVLPYIYLCLILLQGLLLFLSFMVNNRVYMLVLEKFCPRRKPCSKAETTDNSIVMTLSE